MSPTFNDALVAAPHPLPRDHGGRWPLRRDLGLTPATDALAHRYPSAFPMRDQSLDHQVAGEWKIVGRQPLG